MAADWIKMRSSLLTHPRVISMVNHLDKNEDFQRFICDEYAVEAYKTISNDHRNENVTNIVTRSALRYVTVAALLALWSAARIHSDDGMLAGILISDLDEMAGVPGIGKAMEHAGWARYDDERKSVILKDFTSWNDQSFKHQSKTNAERQKAWRERSKMGSQLPVTKRNDRNGRGEERREEKSKEEEKKETPGVLSSVIAETEFNPPCPKPNPADEFNVLKEFTPAVQDASRRFWQAFCGQYHGKSPLRNLHSEQTHKELMHFAKAIDIYGDEAIRKLEAYYANPPKEDRQIHAHGILSKLGLIKPVPPPWEAAKPKDISREEMEAKIKAMFSEGGTA